MGLWEPTQCCCFERRTGSLILAILCLIGAVLLLVTQPLMIADAGNHAHELCTKQLEGNGGNSFKRLEECEILATKILIGVGSSMMVLAVLWLTFSSMLIHGIRKKIPCLMTPFMIMKLVALIFNIIVIVISVGVVLYIGGVRVASILIIICGAGLFLETYFLLVIHAYYREIKQGTGEIHKRLVEDPDNITGVKHFHSKTAYE